MWELMKAHQISRPMLIYRGPNGISGTVAYSEERRGWEWATWRTKTRSVGLEKTREEATRKCEEACNAG